MSGPEINDCVDGGVKAVTQSDSNINLVALSSDLKDLGPMCSLDTTTKELAKFGPYVTTQVDTEQNCPGSAHPSDMHQFLTKDPFSGNAMKLTDFFKEEDIYSAMMENDTVKAALAKAGAAPKNFAELEKMMSAGPGVEVLADHMGSGPPDMKVDAYLDENAMTNFAFKSIIADHYEADVETRILLDYGAEATRNSMPYIDLMLPLPQGQAKYLASADSLSNGFLMKDSQHLGEGSYKHREFPSPFEN